jgi:hypothetical protein
MLVTLELRIDLVRLIIEPQADAGARGRFGTGGSVSAGAWRRD